MNQRQNFLEKLQSSDEATKQRWLVGSAAVIMTFVVFLWFAYFNAFVIEPPRSAVSAESIPAAEGGDVPFWVTMKNGVAVIYNGFLGKLRAFGSVLEAPREYIIKPPTN